FSLHRPDITGRGGLSEKWGLENGPTAQRISGLGLVSRHVRCFSNWLDLGSIHGGLFLNCGQSARGTVRSLLAGHGTGFAGGRGERFRSRRVAAELGQAGFLPPFLKDWPVPGRTGAPPHRPELAWAH